ncbi:DUF4139 domain-containing protein [Kangiella sediminilitoris]|uniref:DUF4139 domain-containing protein n=1 Tax=Kangiella sediminilitoris TaxID=1144748 RepID=A0A1B3BA86_9GAMM|nr:DUF4139 domain-containing protein [Kangiella sediminilitoris]AOE49673.1 hypothetical protein KS2013_951 [Kangiella sediminilitoris]
MLYKHSRHSILTLLITSALYGAPAITGAEDAITIYSSAQPGSISPSSYRPVPGRHIGNYNIPGYAVIKSTQQYKLSEGLNRVEVNNVAALIDPTTVSFMSLTDPEAHVVEQNYQFDLVSQQKLLQRYLGRNITVEQELGNDTNIIKGKLVSAMGGLVLEDERGNVYSINSYRNIKFPSLPGGLRTRPTLVWDLKANKGGKHDIELSYQTEGVTWWSDYNIAYSEEDKCQLDLSAWVSIINQSGTSYENAKLKLIAGDVNRAKAPSAIRSSQVMYEKAAMADSTGFEEKSFFEYHLYTLGRPATLPDNSTKQLELFPSVNAINCDKELVFDASNHYGFSGLNTNQNYGQKSEGDVNVYLRFNNSEDNNMGIPLPAGRIRVNQKDSDGSMEFIGEDIIDHTPKDEDVLIKVGNSFDIKGERTQTDYRVNTKSRTMSESFEITLSNHKTENVQVVIREKLYRWSQWEIKSNSHEFSKQDARHIHFNVNVPASGELKVNYTVNYRW